MAWGDKIDQFNIQQGETVEVSIDLESREYNGRWYTDVKAWKVSRDDATLGSPPPFSDQDHYKPPRMDSSPIGNDDIPFWEHKKIEQALSHKRCESRTYHYKRGAVFRPPSPIRAYQNWIIPVNCYAIIPRTGLLSTGVRSSQSNSFLKPEVSCDIFYRPSARHNWIGDEFFIGPAKGYTS